MKKRYLIIIFILMAFGHEICFSSLLVLAASKDEVIQLEPPLHSVTTSPLYSSDSSSLPWFIQDINAPRLWNNLDTMDISKEVIVAVIDTGVDYTHPDLSDAIWTNSSELNGLPDTDDDNNGYVDDIYGINTYNSTTNVLDNSVGSIHGHGTHIAGTILQVCNVSASSNPYGIKIMALKAGNQYGTFHQTDIIKAIDYAIDHGSTVINLSLGTSQPTKEFQQCIEKASQKAIVIAAAGNQGVAAQEETCGSTSYYPAAYPCVLGVMAYNNVKYMPAFSNYDLIPNTRADYELSAPGVDIYSTLPDNSYGLMTGTSMASAVMSGCAALLQQYFPQSSITDIRQMLLEHRTYNIQKGDNVPTMLTYGSINLADFIVAPSTSPSLIPTRTPVTADTPISTTPAPNTKPSSPTSVTLKAPTISSIKVKNSSITLRWKKVIGSDTFEIFRKSGSKGNYHKYITLPSTTTVFTDKNLQQGVYYYYKIRCKNTSWKTYSAFSASQKVILLKKPEKLALTSKSKKYYLTWSNSVGADGYILYYRPRKKNHYRKIATLSNRKHYYRLPKTYLNTPGYIKLRAYRRTNTSVIYSPYARISISKRN